MRYPASEKLEIIRIVEQSHLPTKITLDKLGVARRTFYRWYDRYLKADRKRWLTGHRPQAACGTVSLTPSTIKSLNWR
jgi:transposase-like protein